MSSGAPRSRHPTSTPSGTSASLVDVERDEFRPSEVEAERERVIVSQLEVGVRQGGERHRQRGRRVGHADAPPEIVIALVVASLDRHVAGAENCHTAPGLRRPTQVEA